MPPSNVRRRARDHLATHSVRSKLPPLLDICPCEPRRLPVVKQAVRIDENLNHWSSYVEKKGEHILGYKQKHPGEGSFLRPPLAEFDVMRPVLSSITP